MHSKVILRKGKGDHLDQVHSDQKVLEMIRQAGPFCRRPRVSRLCPSPLRSDGSRDRQMGGWSV
jgi:hypothetical protein